MRVHLGLGRLQSHSLQYTLRIDLSQNLQSKPRTPARSSVAATDMVAGCPLHVKSYFGVTQMGRLDMEPLATRCRQPGQPLYDLAKLQLINKKSLRTKPFTQTMGYSRF